MSKWFDLESPLIQGLNRVTDLIWLNILTLICCIPVITAGVALTSAHYVALKMKRNEEGYITREFFKAFKTNFKQSTLIWLLVLLTAFIFLIDFYIIKESGIELPNVIQGILMALCGLFVFTVIWVFPMQAKFINSIRRTIKNACALSILQLPKTLLMLAVYVLPYLILYLTARIFPLIILFGISVPVYVSAALYNRIFKSLETRILEKLENEDKTGEGLQAETEEEEKVFSDKPIIGDDKQ